MDDLAARKTELYRAYDEAALCILMDRYGDASGAKLRKAMWRLPGSFAAVRKTKKGLAIASIIMIPVVVGILIFLEFQIDRTETNRYLLYGLYALTLAVPTVCGFLLTRKG